jgi:hypothetical protein
MGFVCSSTRGKRTEVQRRSRENRERHCGQRSQGGAHPATAQQAIAFAVLQLGRVDVFTVDSASGARRADFFTFAKEEWAQGRLAG